MDVLQAYMDKQQDGGCAPVLRLQLRMDSQMALFLCIMRHPAPT